MIRKILIFPIIGVINASICGCVIPIPYPAEDNVTNTEWNIKKLTHEKARYSEVIAALGTPSRKMPNKETNKVISYFTCKTPSGFVGVEYFSLETFDWRDESDCFELVLVFDSSDQLISYSKTAFTGDYVISNDLIKYDVIHSMALKGFPESQWRLYDEFGRKPEDTIWLCRSADNGYAKAQLHLGQIYWGADNIPQNKSKAYVWYKLAATGDKLEGLLHDESTQALAEKFMSDTEKVLTQEQLEEVESLYSDWHPGQCELELVPAITDN